MRSCTMRMKILLLSGAALSACQQNPDVAGLNVSNSSESLEAGLGEANMAEVENAMDAAAAPAENAAAPATMELAPSPAPSAPTYAQPPDPPMPPPPPPPPRGR